MNWILKHWLGVAVLVSWAVAIWAEFHVSHGVSGLLAVPFTLLLVVWLIRGFVRFLGRAWRHGAKSDVIARG